jgi:WD40 repeat protein
VLDATSGEELRTEPAPPPTSTVTGPGGATATIRGDTVAVRSGGESTILRGHRERVTSAEFSPDGARIVTSSRDGEARIWDVATGETAHTLVGHRRAVNDASFSPNGRWVVTAGSSTAGLWDVKTGALVFYLRGHRGPATSATFDPTGLVIVTGGLDGTVRRYLCSVCGDLEELVALAEERLAATGRELTTDERDRYLGR